MNTLNYTKLKKSDVGNVVKGLQQLLADYQVFYTNLRGLHWNIKGVEFYTLHEKYEEMYNDAAEKVDELAERILMLNGTPVSKFSEYLKVSRIKEVDEITKGKDGVALVLENIGELMQQQRDLLIIAGEIDDEATSSMISDYISEQEKTVWMLTSYLS